MEPARPAKEVAVEQIRKRRSLNLDAGKHRIARRDGGVLKPKRGAADDENLAAHLLARRAPV